MESDAKACSRLRALRAIQAGVLSKRASRRFRGVEHTKRGRAPSSVEHDLINPNDHELVFVEVEFTV